MKAALIFDMDGVIVDSNAAHKKTWQQFCERHQSEGKCGQFSDKDMEKHVYGKTNRDAIKFMYGDDLSDEQISRYAEEKEALYREVFKPDMRPTEGLVDFLKQAQPIYCKPAIGTSAPPANVDFVLDNLNLRQYFGVIVDETMIKKGKPDPEIYLKVSELIQVPPERCIVFEDSLAGVAAGKSAGMRVVAITTTHSKEEFPTADMVIDDFNDLAKNPKLLDALLNESAAV